MRLRRALFLLLALAGGGAAALPACGDAAPLLLCGEIPAGGCPIGRGGTCDDKVCLGLYDCVEGAWTRVESCSPAAGSGGGGGGGDAGADATCAPVMIDHTGEAAGCKPDLENPDCPVAAAEDCATAVCLTGCEDFFLCTKDGWSLVAYCDDSGQIVVSP